MFSFCQTKVFYLITGTVFLYLLVTSWLPAAATTPTTSPPDIRLILQSQAGISAYATITNTISLPYVRPLFSAIDQENESYILGDYQLAGRPDTVKLAIGSEGWAIAYHTPATNGEYLYDCLAFNGATPGIMVNQPERAIIQVAAAINTPAPTINFYDFENPDAEGLTLHWLFLPNSGSGNSTINLPLANTYLERGYAFCTALTNSKFWLNGAIVDQQGSISQVIIRRGTLDETQLRAGQTNNLEIEALSFFGYGFVAGISTTYSGSTPLPSTGGYQRTLLLSYPPMLGEPLTIYPLYLPALFR